MSPATPSSFIGLVLCLQAHNEHQCQKRIKACNAPLPQSRNWFSSQISSTQTTISAGSGWTTSNPATPSSTAAIISSKGGRTQLLRSTCAKGIHGDLPQLWIDNDPRKAPMPCVPRLQPSFHRDCYSTIAQCFFNFRPPGLSEPASLPALASATFHFEQ